MSKKTLTDSEILSIFVSYLDQDILIDTPLTRVSPLTLSWLNDLYYGQPVIYDYAANNYVAASLGDCRLILKPLSITDELCLSLGKEVFPVYSDEKKITEVRNQLGSLKFGSQCDYRLVARLKQRGIAVPYFGMSLFKHGIAILEEDALKLINDAGYVDFPEIPIPEEDPRDPDGDDYDYEEDDS